MQPNANRPVYTVQPPNVTHLNIRPTTVTSGVQQVQPPPQLVYQISAVRQPTLAQPASTLYQVQPQQQPRLVTSSPVYGALQAQRFATSPQQIVTPNASISPRLITPQAGSRLTMVTAPTASSTILRPAGTSAVTQPIAATGSPAAATAALTTQPAAPGNKEFVVKIPKTRAQYGIMEFASGLSIEVKDWKAVEMRREINPYTYRAPSSVDPSGPSSNTITTSLGAVLPKTGAGSEYGREQKEALKRKRYATKGTNIEDLPWVLTDRSSSGKLKHYRGLKKGGVTTNSSYYVFIQGRDGFEAYPVEDWYGFSPTNVYKTLEFDEAEKQYQERHKNLSKWFLKHQAKNEKEVEEDADGEKEKEKKTVKKGKRDFKLLDSEDWINEEEANDDDDDDDDDGDAKEKSGKKSKSSKKDGQKNKGAWTLSDEDDDDEGAKRPAKKTKRQQKEDQKEDSDDGDREGYEVEYSSDESSDDEDDRDVNTADTNSKYEIKGVDEEMKTMPDIEKKLEQMDETGGEIDFFDDDEEEDVPEVEDNDDENGKAPGDDIGDVGTLLSNDAFSKEMESSSDDDDMDDSDDPDKELSESATATLAAQQPPLEQVKTEKGHKKAREEEMRAIKSKVMSLPAIPPNPNETITEEKVRNLLQRRQQMSVTEIIQHFRSKSDQQRKSEINASIVERLATILKNPSFEKKMINKTCYVKLK